MSRKRERGEEALEDLKKLARKLEYADVQQKQVLGAYLITRLENVEAYVKELREGGE